MFQEILLYFYISLLNLVTFGFLSPPFSQGRVVQWCCLFQNELLSKIFLCLRSKVLILLLSVLIHLCVTIVSPLTIVPTPVMISLDILHPIPFWMHLSVSALDCETKSSNHHCKFSNFLSTNAVLPWSFCLESLFCNMTPVFLMLVFAVVVST